MIKIGNLFDLAEKQLIKEKRTGKIPCYTGLDVIEYAIQIRKFLDHNPIKINKIMRLTKEIKMKNFREYRKRYYLKTGR